LESTGGAPLLAALGDFIARELPAHQSEWGTAKTFDARVAWQRRLATERFVALSWPEDHGGRALSIADRLRCEQELALAGAPTPAGTLGLNNVGPTLIRFGTPEQQRHLPAIRDTSEIWCQGFSEPDAGSDLASLRAQAAAVDDGFEITGRKVWTTNGLHATHCMLLARTDLNAPAHRGISAFLLPLDSDGIERRPIRQMDGEAEFAEITFDQVRVGPSALLGPLHEGWRVTMTTLSFERAGVISEAALIERDVVAELRQVEGDLSRGCIDQFVALYVRARALSLLGARALAGLEAGGQPGPEHSLIRLAQSTLRQELAEATFRARGVSAIAGEVPDIARDLLTSRSVTIAAGTTEVLKNVLAERVLGLPKG
jgi:alkylation response protein AidB-like acyl-CoA dehydrogenase